MGWLGSVQFGLKGSVAKRIESRRQMYAGSAVADEGCGAVRYGLKYSPAKGVRRKRWM